MSGPRPTRPQWVSVHKREGDPNSGLLCKVDPERWMVEIQVRGEKHYVDLARIYHDWVRQHGQEAA
jgi:hypothetical protein